MTFSRHPDPLKLAAWFDGETSGTTGSHVTRCARCQRSVAEWARIRSWLRAQPFVAMGPNGEAGAGRRTGARRIVALAAAVVAAVLTASAVGDGGRGPRPTAGQAAPARGETEGREATGPALGAPAGEAGAEAPRGAREARGTATPRSSASALAAKRVTGPLRLGIVVPSSGPLALEGREVVEVVRRRVDAANASGGVAGVPVELVVAPAEDRAAVEAMARRVTAMVGGFGADVTTSVPWLLPADPGIDGPNVVRAELPAEAAGAHLAAALRRQGLQGPIGVVVGTGPDSALVEGLAANAAVRQVTARTGTTCLAEIATLQRAGAVALAVAGDTDLVASCVRTASRTWPQRFGPLVPPSAAYGHVEALPEAAGSRTVLALPWPTSTSAGASRFRASTGSTSYRALVSFAATELAIEIARQVGTVSLPAAGAGVWRSDLVTLDHGELVLPNTVFAFLGTWLGAPAP